MTHIAEIVPAELNGFPVIERRESVRSGEYIVMVYRASHTLHPYVVARWYAGLGTTWEHGDYAATTAEASKAFASRR